MTSAAGQTMAGFIYAETNVPKYMHRSNISHFVDEGGGERVVSACVVLSFGSDKAATSTYAYMFRKKIIYNRSL
jgi:hypothetical protein